MKSVSDVAGTYGSIGKEEVSYSACGLINLQHRISSLWMYQARNSMTSAESRGEAAVHHLTSPTDRTGQTSRRLSFLRALALPDEYEALPS